VRTPRLGEHSGSEVATLALPNFFLIGAPKAGTTALHAALAGHPGLYLSPVKEPKYFLCDDAPPARLTGPGDAHSAREWVWQRDRYEALFDSAPPGALRGESTPLYLHDRAALERIRRAVPDAKLIAVLRDPVDRAHSNWMHLWSDGLETIGDFVEACDAEAGRVAAGYAPFWRYRGLGRYGEQLERLYEVFDPAQVHVLRYRELVDEPVATLAAIGRFLGVPVEGVTAAPAAENSRPYVPDSASARALGQVIRAGAAVGAWFPPRVWRRVSGPLIALRHRNGTNRPRLTPEERWAVLAPLVDDIRKLERITGQSFADWLGDEGRGEFAGRQAQASEAQAAGSAPAAVETAEPTGVPAGS
jgi:hypothetical protein